MIYVLQCLQCDQLLFGEPVHRRPLGDVHLHADGRRPDRHGPLAVRRNDVQVDVVLTR